MKFQKGILSDEQKEERRQAAAIHTSSGPEAKPIILRDVEKNRLFETQQEFTGSSRQYLKVLGILGVVVLIAIGALVFFMRPGIGDRITAPRGLEDAVRDNFLTAQKRTATDITFYNCDSFYWARVGVETRTDISNPIYRIYKYAAKATPAGENAWNITAQPITSPDIDVPCK